MSLTEWEGVNLEKLERRVKGDVKKDTNSLFLLSLGMTCTGSRSARSLYGSELLSYTGGNCCLLPQLSSLVAGAAGRCLFRSLSLRIVAHFGV